MPDNNEIRNIHGLDVIVVRDMTNQEPQKVLDTDWETYSNLCDVVKFV